MRKGRKKKRAREIEADREREREGSRRADGQTDRDIEGGICFLLTTKSAGANSKFQPNCLWHIDIFTVFYLNIMVGLSMIGMRITNRKINCDCHP